MLLYTSTTLKAVESAAEHMRQQVVAGKTGAKHNHWTQSDTQPSAQKTIISQSKLLNTLVLRDSEPPANKATFPTDAVTIAARATLS